MKFTEWDYQVLLATAEKKINIGNPSEWKNTHLFHKSLSSEIAKEILTTKQNILSELKDYFNDTKIEEYSVGLNIKYCESYLNLIGSFIYSIGDVGKLETSVTTKTNSGYTIIKYKFNWHSNSNDTEALKDKIEGIM